MGRYDGYLGTTADADASDPVWSLGEDGKAWWDLTDWDRQETIKIPGFSTGHSEWTVIFRYKTDQAYSNARLLTDGTGDYWQAVSTGSPYFNWEGYVVGGTWPADGNEHTMALVSKPGVDSVYSYVDGTLVGRRSDPRDQDLSGGLSLFHYQTPTSGYEQYGFYGSVGDMLVYDRALSDSEIQDNHGKLLQGYCDQPAGLTLDVSPDSANVKVAGVIQYDAQYLDVEGTAHTGIPTVWSVQDASVASVNSLGQVTGESLGTTWVIARGEEEGQRDSAKVVVREEVFVEDGLRSHWTTCEGFGGQIVHDRMGNYDGHLGATASIDSNDPEWVRGPDGKAWWAATDWSRYEAIKIPNFTTQHSEWTYMFRFKTDQAYSNSYAFSDGASGELQMSSTGTPSAIWDGYWVGGTNIWSADGQEHTMALVSKPGVDVMELYVDGSRVATRSDSRDQKLTGGLTLMYYPTLSSGYEQYGYYGWMGDVLVYDRALSESEIADNHSKLLEGFCDQPAALTLEVSPDSADVKLGKQTKYEATFTDSEGQKYYGLPVTWESRDTLTAAVDSLGQVAGQALGTTWIVAEGREDGQVDSAKVVVREEAFIDDGLRAHWTTCEGFGGQVVHDRMGNYDGYLGTSTGVDANDPEWVIGEGGKAWWAATSVSKYEAIKIPNFTTKHSEWTYIFRFKTDHAYSNSYAFSDGASGELQMSSTGTPSVNWDGYPLGGTNSWQADGQEHTMALVSRPGVDSLELYVDGSRVGIRSDGRDQKIQGGLTFMYYPSVSSGYEQYGYHGWMGDVLVYDRALSGSEIVDTHEKLLEGYCDQPLEGTQLVVQPDSNAVEVGDTILYTAFLEDEAAGSMTGVEAVWSTADTSIAAVAGSEGHIVAKKLGTTQVIAEAFGKTDTATVFVTQEVGAGGELVAYWSTCEGVGSNLLVDRIGGNHGMLGDTASGSGAPAWNVDDYGRAWLDFGGSGQRWIRVPDLTTPDASHTFTFVVKASTLADVNARALTAGNGDYIQLASSGSPTLIYDAYPTTTTWPVDGQMHTIGVVKDALRDSIHVYVDGQVVAARSDTRNGRFTGGFTFGHYSSPTSGYAQYAYKEAMGDILLYNGALSADQMLQDHEFLTSSVPVDCTWDGAPKARFTYSPERIWAGDEISFDATQSIDAQSEIMEFDWDFADFSSSSYSATPTHTFSSPGSYEVQLIVTDVTGRSDTTVQTVAVMEPAILKHDWDYCASYDSPELIDVVAGVNAPLINPRWGITGTGSGSLIYSLPSEGPALMQTNGWSCGSSHPDCNLSNPTYAEVSGINSSSTSHSLVFTVYPPRATYGTQTLFSALNDSLTVQWAGEGADGYTGNASSRGDQPLNPIAGPAYDPGFSHISYEGWGTDRVTVVAVFDGEGKEARMYAVARDGVLQELTDREGTGLARPYEPKTISGPVKLFNGFSMGSYALYCNSENYCYLSTTSHSAFGDDTRGEGPLSGSTLLSRSFEARGSFCSGSRVYVWSSICGS